MSGRAEHTFAHRGVSADAAFVRWKEEREQFIVMLLEQITTDQPRALAVLRRDRESFCTLKRVSPHDTQSLLHRRGQDVPLEPTTLAFGHAKLLGEHCKGEPVAEAGASVTR